jgi:phospholipase/lecithinase/hemolysin
MTLLPAESSIYSQVYVFGDSFSDIGNAYYESEMTLASAPNLPGRFADGEIWVELLAKDWQLCLEPSCSAAIGHPAVNFAFGGATTGATNLFPAIMPQLPAMPGLQQQIATFIQGHQQGDYAISKGTFAIVWAGAADYAPFVNGVPQETEPTQPMQNLQDAVAKLVEAGISQVLVLNVPDLSLTPLAGMVAEITPAAAVSSAIAAHNQALAAWVETQATVQLFDVNALLGQILAQPEIYGFNNIQQGASMVDGANAMEYVFWDQVHLTAKAHQVLAEAVRMALGQEGLVAV